MIFVRKALFACVFNRTPVSHLMSSAASICPTCQIRSALQSLQLSRQSWQQQRSAASAMRRRREPSRMVLTPDVGRTGGRRMGKKREHPGPFGAMNMRQVPRDLQPVQQDTRPAATPTTKLEGTVSKIRKAKEDRPLYHALKMQETLTPMSYTQRDKLKAKLAEITTFEELGLMPSVVDAVFSQALPGLTTYTPTPAQKLAVPALLGKTVGPEPKKARQATDEDRFDTFMLAAETGSGKTLAYLLPVIDNIKRHEKVDDAAEAEKEAQEKADFKSKLAANKHFADPFETEEKTSSAGRPRALILMPSTELVNQVGKVAKVMSHTIKYRVEAISSSNTPTVIRSKLFRESGIDVVISTPHLISSIAEKEPNILSRVQYLVVDEADSLLDRSFHEITRGIIDRAAPSLKQLILCSATIPRSLDKYVDGNFPSARRLVTPKIHSIERRVQLGVVDIDKELYRGNRNLACADVIWTIGKAVHDDTSKHNTVKCMMVFVNERDQAEELAKFLASKGVDAVPFTRDTSEQRQNDILAAFTSAARVEGGEKTTSKTREFRDFVPFDGGQPDAGELKRSLKHLSDVKVLVTTDLGSRGIDTLAVRHVILYDVPHTTIDFIHRLGRIGRMGRRGRGVVLVGKHDRKDIVREVKEAMHKGQALI